MKTLAHHPNEITASIPEVHVERADVISALRAL